MNKPRLSGAFWSIPLAAACSWLYLTADYGTPVSPDGRCLLFWVLMGILPPVLDRSSREDFPGGIGWWGVLLGGAVLAAALPWPYRGGALTLTAGGLTGGFGTLPARNPLLKRFMTTLRAAGAALVLMGGALLSQAAVLPMLRNLLARHHEVPLVQWALVPVLRFFGLPATSSDGAIFAVSFTDLLVAPESLERWGVYPLALIVVGGTAVLALTAAKPRSFLKFYLTCALYAVVRMLVMLAFFVQSGRAELYWLTELTVAATVPILLPLWRYVEPGPGLHVPTGEANGKTPFRRLMLLGAACACCGFFGMAAAGFSDPGQRKEGRVLMDERIDETHSNWERSDRPFDTSWYGGQSSYNYYNLADWLGMHYDVTVNTDKDLTPEYLAAHDVLILKTPTRPYSEAIRKAVIDFVHNGGGLWMIGDHTNVFGSSYYINPVARAFGIHFAYDSTYDLKHGSLNLYRPPELFPHPVVKEVPYFLFATSCSLGAPLFTEDVIIGPGLRGRPLAYSGRSFFEDKPLQNYGFGPYLLTVGATAGKGRVLAYSDSTCFSNFYMYLPGKPELALGSVEWLNRRNRLNSLNLIFALLAMGAGASVCILRYRDPSGAAWSLILSILPVGCAISAILFSWQSSTAAKTPPPHRSYRQIAFDEQHSGGVLPQYEYVDRHPENYHTFFVWTQRKGFVPSVKPTLEAALGKSEMVVALLPEKPYTPEEVGAIRNYVEEGGSYLILDYPGRTRGRAHIPSGANSLLNKFGLHMDLSTRLPKGTIRDVDTGKPLVAAEACGTVTGGEAVWSMDGKAVFVVKSVGKGMIGAISCARLFSVQTGKGKPEMGGTLIRPSERQLKIYEMEYQVLDLMVPAAPEE